MANRTFFSLLWLTVSVGLMALLQTYLSYDKLWDRKETSLSEEEIDENKKNYSQTNTVQNQLLDQSKSVAINLNTSSLCTREQVIDGEWVEQVLDAPPYIPSTVHLRCYPRRAYYSSQWRTWTWKPKSCKLEQWDKHLFCRLLSYANVSIIGDSLSWEQYRSLVQLNGLKGRQNYQHQSHALDMNIVQTVCDGKTKLVFRRDDRLSKLTDSISKNFPTVLILNRGAHYAEDSELLPAIRRNIDEVRIWLDSCDKRGIKCHFFWRTSVPGHPSCWNFTQPVNNISAIEGIISDPSQYNDRSIKYHWYDYQRQNQLVLQDFSAAKLSNFGVIDAYYLNVRRPDEHRAHQSDCLHSCFPGKMDIYNVLLLHYLKIQRNMADVDKLDNIAHSGGWTFENDTVYNPDIFRSGRSDAKKGKRNNVDAIN
jgi:hypothetical protein